MVYLVARIVVLLMLASACGFLLARWWLRRRYRDVTEEYKQLVRDSSNRGVAAEEGWRRIEERLAALERALRDIQAPDLRPIEVGLGGVRDRIAALESLAGGREMPDLAPLSMRIQRLQQQVEAPRPLLERSAAPVVASISRPLRADLMRSGNGRPDDLKRIRGIGWALERLLHRHGVYYFWQIAEWDDDDVSLMEEHLDVFKERIARDRWVPQAKELAGESGAAKPSVGFVAGDMTQLPGGA